MDKLLFKPVLGSEAKIMARKNDEGSIYFATDTGKIFLDADDQRINMGGAGAAIYYGKTAPTSYVDSEGNVVEGNPSSDSEETKKAQYWIIEKTTLMNDTDNPVINDIILTIQDGTFYKVEKIQDSNFYCQRLSISGGGAIGPVQKIQPFLKIEPLENANIINGADVRIYFTATSSLEANGEPLDPDLNISWELCEGTDELNKNNNESYRTGLLEHVPSGERYYLDFGSYLRKSTTSILYLTATGPNHLEPSATRTVKITSTALSLTLDGDFSNLSPFTPSSVAFTVEATGAVDKYLEVKFDGEVQTGSNGSRIIKADSLETDFDISIDPSKCTHGPHQVEVNLYQMINGIKRDPTTPIKFEVAVDAGDPYPIIWLGNYKSTYSEYDSIRIPYLAYDPQHANKATVHLYKNGIEYTQDVRYIESRKEFATWEISDIDIPISTSAPPVENRYAISCGIDDTSIAKSYRDIIFKVEKDKRDLSPAEPTRLRLDFNPVGRSKTESRARRDKWTYKGKYGNVTANFENFNWSNNGWDTGDNRKTMLRITNGAKLSFPIGSTNLSNDSEVTRQSATFELQFKIKNVQNYTDLITNISRYNIPKFNEDGEIEYTDDGKIVYESDRILCDEFKTGKTGFLSYDSFLQHRLQSAYDLMEFVEVEKLLNLSNAVCKYCSGSGQNIVGWAIGSQDAFFKDGLNTVSVSFAEDDLISLSIVYKYEPDPAKRNMIYFYLNGVISGVAYSNPDSDFTIQSPAIEFNSDVCDIELYRLRVYNTALDVKDIVKNYTVDYSDIDNFDLLKAAKQNGDIGEYRLQFGEIENWNLNHPDNPTMPYIIFDTSGTRENKLSYSKSNSVPVTVTFVNPALDLAYAAGELEELAIQDKLCLKDSSLEDKLEAVKTYYKHHCPSWTGNNIELVVQGTSSEYYPRRNYKIKTKTDYDADEKERVHIFLNEGPFKNDYKKDQNDLAAGNIALGEESTRQKYWYMNNYTNGTHKWTMKVDFMESSGSYNAGFASMMGTAYTKHPLKDYIDKEAFNTTVVEYKKDEDGKPTDEVKKTYNGLASDIHFTENNGIIRWNDYRTSLLGFPVMAFHKTGDDDYTFIGYYRMLLDKGSDEVLGFKPPKGVTNTLLGNKNVRDIAECWEFSNNNRTYCSYRDQWDRNVLSFMPPKDSIENRKGLTAKGIPVVADCFEYRYHTKEDYLDILYNLGTYDRTSGKWSFAGDEKDKLSFKKETGIDLSDTNSWNAAYEKMIEWYSNWEKVCQWIWSTNVDNVESMGEYSPAQVGTTPFKTDGSLWVWLEGQYVPVTSGTFNPDILYHYQVIEEKDGETNITYDVAYVYDSAFGNKYEYAPNKFYQKINGDPSLVNNKEFDPDIEYFELLINDNYKNKTDRLVEKATEFKEGVEYYTWNKEQTTAKIRQGEHAVVSVGPGISDTAAENGEHGITRAMFEDPNNEYYVGITVKYGEGREYTYDTKEYRTDKFSSELSQHFDIEYLATYFIMTEVFECYDSRGKNCMMASWGPQEAGGDYIWYPIFYDIDTQLGINNTGIPSFTFNVDATINNNYSTSDSILWNNFYSFKRGEIINKYKNLKGDTSSSYRTLANPPLKSIDTIEKWYLFDEDKLETNLALHGLRPLIATNLDAWYKYITITNTIGSVNEDYLGLVGYMGRQGEWLIDSEGTYFYALQGDRKQSRRAFLTKRLDYIDSWLSVGDYQRSGTNCIWGRISANDAKDTSDVWLDRTPAEDSYWVLDEAGKETAVKTHPYDAQYWLDLTPVYSTYVTVSDDAAAYPSQKYDGKESVKFMIDAVESGVRNSKDYKEQLLYIYGSHKMLDIGDMSNLYWREFKIDGDASKLTRLKLGHDGVVNDYYYDAQGKRVDVPNMKWKNGYLNKPIFPAGSGSSGMPLLQEVNLCNITIQGGTTLDFSTCTKLKDFRATGSNLTNITFAPGVALHTLYLPSTVTNLSLTNANSLLTVLQNYTTPSVVNNKLTAIPGLYIEGFFDEDVLKRESQISNIYLEGGSLGYHSFDLFKKFYNRKKELAGNRLSMKDIVWTPYVQLVDGDVYEEGVRYYQDNSHYGLEEYEYIDDTQFNNAIVRGELYRLDESLLAKSTEVNEEIYDALLDLIQNTNITSASDSNKHAELTGSIYIDNSNAASPIDEDELATVLQQNYPSLKIFASKVKSAYSAKFVIVKDDGSYDYVPDINGDKTHKSIQTVAQETFNQNTTQGVLTVFKDPFLEYNPRKSKEHYDFVGWTKVLNPTEKDIFTEDDHKAGRWGTEYNGHKWGIVEAGEYNSIYYAVYTERTYTATFIDNDNADYTGSSTTKYNPAGSFFSAEKVIDPVCQLPSDEGFRNAFKGWTATQEYGGLYEAYDDLSEIIVDVTSFRAIRDIPFYAVYQKENVYDVATDMKYFSITGGVLTVNPDYKDSLAGKITLPLKDASGNFIKFIDSYAFYQLSKITHVYFQKPQESQYTTIRQYAFSECTNLKVVELPPSLTRLEHGVFAQDKALKLINLQNITYIFNSAFMACETLELNDLPPNVTYIGTGAFRYCYKIFVDELPPSLEFIGSRAFEKDTNVTVARFGGDTDDFKLRQIDEYAFSMSENKHTDSGITEIYLGKSLTTIGQNAFSNYGIHGAQGVVAKYHPDLVLNNKVVDHLTDSEKEELARSLGLSKLEKQ